MTLETLLSAFPSKESTVRRFITSAFPFGFTAESVKAKEKELKTEYEEILTLAEDGEWFDMDRLDEIGLELWVIKKLEEVKENKYEQSNYNG